MSASFEDLVTNAELKVPTDAGIDTLQLARRIRLHALRMTSRGGSSHVGSVLSMVDIVAVLYGAILRVDPTRPNWPERDRFILSKGHAGAGVYAALAERGFFDLEQLDSHYQNGSLLSGHISHKGIPGVELSTGSLGHGLSVGAGLVYGARLDGSARRTFVLLSDGECDEGSVWEAVLFAAHHKLDHLVAIVDYNKIQSLDSVASTLALEPFADKWRSFGWTVVEIHGHDHAQLKAACGRVPAVAGSPTCVLAHTTKGKGVSFMENSVLWHYRTPAGQELEDAVREVEAGP
jgi:transketolase